MSTKAAGDLAENIAANKLESLGHKIIHRNWRTKVCEIDIITKNNGVINFVEVKYRKKPFWGDGLDAINSQKLQQMEYASQIWCQNNNWQGPVSLMAVSVYGEPPKIDKIIEI
jgi:uncharacterized protein (TIGR00252 family)